MPLIFKAIFFGLGAFVFSAWLVRGAVWNAAWHMSIRYRNIDCDAISRRVEGQAYSKEWLAASVAGSMLEGLGFYFGEDYLGIAAMLLGIFVIGGYIGWQGFRDFYRAVREIGVPWPPHPRDQKWP
jgi:hypothetical protein